MYQIADSNKPTMCSLDKYQKLIMQHAYYSDLIKRLKREGYEEYGRCDRPFRDVSKTKDQDTFDSDFIASLRRIKGDQFNCIGNAFAATLKMQAENPLEFTFDEIYGELVACGLVCRHCENVRRLKEERTAASRKLGAVRGAMTRMGRKLAEEANQ
ncbi:hypothetical protein SAMN04487867_10492 [Vreelandella titanicae]|uniref:hypothetical protein n=1 Tax=Vreelandella titanicae TaxID=664683 RepID=UPI000882FEE5|nr:hypothetical protein [Halomonas titanicae]SDI28447.1 hypothetical protein SAMN04487867_10492 [Halomonas titanicae]